MERFLIVQITEGLTNEHFSRYLKAIKSFLGLSLNLKLLMKDQTTGELVSELRNNRWMMKNDAITHRWVWNFWWLKCHLNVFESLGTGLG
jgi:hypothetical protein